MRRKKLTGEQEDPEREHGAAVAVEAVDVASDELIHIYTDLFQIRISCKCFLKPIWIVKTSV